jgi:hypothetical protein
VTLRVVRQLDEHRWRRFVMQQGGGNIFHTPEMFEVFRRTEGHAPELWAVTEDDEGPIRALFAPVRVAVFGGILAPWTTRSIAYGGLLAPVDGGGDAALHLLLSTYADGTRIPLFTEIRNIEDTSVLRRTFKTCGFAYEPHLNFLVRLDRPPEQIMEAFGRRTRREVRRLVRQQHVRVTVVERREDLAIWYRTLKDTYDRAGVPLAPPGLFSAAFDVLHPRGMVRMAIAWAGDAPAASTAELVFKDRVYGWYGGTDRRFSSLRPNEVLTWTVLEWGSLNGYAVYDFGGAGRPDEPYGVRDFKAKFGGDLVEYGRYVAVHGRARLAASRTAFGLYRGLRRRRATAQVQG